MKALCNAENLRKKSAVPVKMSHPCALYTQLRQTCTEKRHEEFISIEKRGRLRVERLFDNFNINICDNPISTTE